MKNTIILFLILVIVYLLYFIFYSPNLINDKSFSSYSISKGKWKLKNAKIRTQKNGLYYASIGRVGQVLRYPLIVGNDFLISFDARVKTNCFLTFGIDNYYYHKFYLTNDFWKTFKFHFSPILEKSSYYFYFLASGNDFCGLKEINFKRMRPFLNHDFSLNNIHLDNNLINNGLFDSEDKHWIFSDDECFSISKFKGLNSLLITSKNNESVSAQQKVHLEKDKIYDLEALLYTYDIRAYSNLNISLICFNNDNSVYTNITLSPISKPNNTDWTIFKSYIKPSINTDALFIISVTKTPKKVKFICSGIKIF